MSFTIAIIGRPNVGKSTLFNRLVGQKLALVDDEPGVTRDRREGEGRLGDLEFTVIDTAGLDEGAKGSLTARMQEQTETAIALAGGAGSGSNGGAPALVIVARTRNQAATASELAQLEVPLAQLLSSASSSANPGVIPSFTQRQIDGGDGGLLIKVATVQPEGLVQAVNRNELLDRSIGRVPNIQHIDPGHSVTVLET